MKKTLKTMLAFVAGALALSACSNEDILNESENNGGAKLVTLTAYQEGDGTKAAIDGTTSTQIDWTAGDKINYFGGGTDEYMTLKTGDGTAEATFEGTVTPGANNYVLYPFNARATCTSGTITTYIPSAQSVPAGTFDPAAALMVGKVNGTSVQFYNAVGYIAIKIPAGSSNITKMVITGNNNERLSGKVTISNITTNAAPTIAGTTRSVNNTLLPKDPEYVIDGVKYVEVTPKGTTTFTAGSTYYVAVAPDATLSAGIYVLLYDGSKAKPATLKLAVKKSSNSLGMARNKVKKVALPAIANDDWKGMIALETEEEYYYMAPFNLGATKSTNDDGEASYGNYYAYGEIDTKSDYSQLSNTEGLADAATSNWGPDWRMLSSNDWKYIVGYYPDGDNPNSDFLQNLPKGGVADNYSTGKGTLGYYWTYSGEQRIERPSEGSAYYAYRFCSTNNQISLDQRKTGFSVRPFSVTEIEK